MKTTRASWVGLVATSTFVQFLVVLATFTSAAEPFYDDDADLMLGEVGSQVSAMGDGDYENWGKGFRYYSTVHYRPPEFLEECLRKRIAYRYTVYCSSVKAEDRVKCGGASEQQEGITKKDCVQGLGCCFDDSATTPNPATPNQGGDQVSQVMKCFHPNLKHAEVARLKYKINSAKRGGERIPQLRQQK